MVFKKGMEKNSVSQFQLMFASMLATVAAVHYVMTKVMR